MTSLRALYHLMLADFLERVRRYSFLIVLLATIVAGYSMVPSVGASYNAFAIGPHRPFYSSAWVGTVFGLVVATLVSLLGFYLVRDSVVRDYRTRVGQIIATTPVSKPLYLLGKWLSNVAVLATILAVLSLVALVMQLVRAEDTSINLWKLWAPMWFMGLPILALAAAAAVLFECLPLLRSGIGSAVYFFLWVWFLVANVAPSFDSIADVVPGNDLIGITRTMVDIRDRMIAFGYDPTEGVIDLYEPTGGKETIRFEWQGVDWGMRIALERLLWIGLAVAVVLLAILPFDRFDPARSRILVERKSRRHRRGSAKREGGDGVLECEVGVEPTHLSPLPHLEPRRRLGTILLSEFRLLVKGQPWWWYAGLLGLNISCLAVPYPVFQRFMVPLIWIWPIFLWSVMGNRERQHQAGQLVFPCTRLMVDQLPALWFAGVLVAAVSGSGAVLRLAIGGEGHLLFGWFVGVLFVPALALAVGVWTSSRRWFEMLYFAIWFLGVNSRGRVQLLDFLGRGGTSAGTDTPGFYLLITAMLLVLALVGRRKQIHESLR